MTREDNHTTTVALLDGFANGNPDDVLRLGDLLKDFGPAAFGMLLFLGVLPAFIPVPGVGGAVGGPLVILVGVQLLLGMRKLWLPGFLARRGPHRSAMMRFRQRMAPCCWWHGSQAVSPWWCSVSCRATWWRRPARCSRGGFE